MTINSQDIIARIKSRAISLLKKGNGFKCPICTGSGTLRSYNNSGPGGEAEDKSCYLCHKGIVSDVFLLEVSKNTREGVWITWRSGTSEKGVISVDSMRRLNATYTEKPFREDEEEENFILLVQSLPENKIRFIREENSGKW